jgi:hypothetical protein
MIYRNFNIFYLTFDIYYLNSEFSRINLYSNIPRYLLIILKNHNK